MMKEKFVVLCFLLSGITFVSDAESIFRLEMEVYYNVFDQAVSGRSLRALLRIPVAHLSSKLGDAVCLSFSNEFGRLQFHGTCNGKEIENSILFLHGRIIGFAQEGSVALVAPVSFPLTVNQKLFTSIKHEKTKTKFIEVYLRKEESGELKLDHVILKRIVSRKPLLFK